METFMAKYSTAATMPQMSKTDTGCAFAVRVDRVIAILGAAITFSVWLRSEGASAALRYLCPSTRNDTFAFTRYSVIRSPETEPVKLSIQTDLMFFTVLATSFTAFCAASSKLFSDWAMTSTTLTMVLMGPPMEFHEDSLGTVGSC